MTFKDVKKQLLFGVIVIIAGILIELAIALLAKLL
jgi:hypothetical protein